MRGADDAELLAVIKPLRAAGAEFGIYADGILVKKGRRLAERCAVPIPLIFAPAALRKWHRCTTSGSLDSGGNKV